MNTRKADFLHVLRSLRFPHSLRFPRSLHSLGASIATALRALRALIADPDDTPRVFEILRALGLRSVRRRARRFASTRLGRSIHSRPRELVDVLGDRAALARLPAASLGRVYCDFIRREQLSAEGLAEASLAADAIRGIEDPQLARFIRHVRDQHDLWHTVTGDGRNPFGEVCLLAFTYAQMGNPGIALIAFAGIWKIFRGTGNRAIFKAVWKAYRAGRRASWLPAEDWEALLPLPLDDVRRQLAIQPSQSYREAMAAMAPG